MFKVNDRIKITRIEDDGSFEVDYAVGDTGEVIRSDWISVGCGIYDVKLDNGKYVEVFVEDMELV